ncbi:MAG: SLOG family protein [Hydrogenoanaerobacterium sp.]
MQNKEQALCFTGHRSEKLPKTEEEMKRLKLKLWEEIDKSIENGIDTFYFGGCYGWDLLCAEVVLNQRKIIRMDNPHQIRLIGVLPYEEQAIRWSEANRETYYNTLAQCDEVITLYTHFQRGCYHERNRYMVDRSSEMICYYDGVTGGTAYTVKYAKQNNLKITNLY